MTNFDVVVLTSASSEMSNHFEVRRPLFADAFLAHTKGDESWVVMRRSFGHVMPPSQMDHTKKKGVQSKKGKSTG